MSNFSWIIFCSPTVLPICNNTEILLRHYLVISLWATNRTGYFCWIEAKGFLGTTSPRAPLEHSVTSQFTPGTCWKHIHCVVLNIAHFVQVLHRVKSFPDFIPLNLPSGGGLHWKKKPSIFPVFVFFLGLSPTFFAFWWHWCDPSPPPPSSCLSLLSCFFFLEVIGLIFLICSCGMQCPISLEHFLCCQYLLSVCLHLARPLA